jgi:formate dehydrogenase subunit gamma
MPNKMLKRHTIPGIFIHWFNAVCWLFLMITGLGLINNPDLAPLGSGFANTVRGLFGGGTGLFWAHVGVGAVWAGVWLLFILAGIAHFTIPFMRQIMTYRLPQDLHWMIKKNFQMILGYDAMAKISCAIGLDERIPDQDYYNAGQKAAAVAFVGGGALLAVTGLLMVLSKFVFGPEQVALVQWSITLHFLAAGITFAVLLVHVYMAAISPEERPAFISMFTGYVPAEYAKHHHRLWYDNLDKK